MDGNKRIIKIILFSCLFVGFVVSMLEIKNISKRDQQGVATYLRTECYHTSDDECLMQYQFTYDGNDYICQKGTMSLLLTRYIQKKDTSHDTVYFEANNPNNCWVGNNIDELTAYMLWAILLGAPICIFIIVRNRKVKKMRDSHKTR